MQRPPNSEPLLRLEAVRLTLMSQAGPVNILNGIDLKVGKGEAIGLVGPSGSGKSTLLMVMSGLERPTSGKVTVAGQELSKFDEDAAARFRRGNVGIVFQSFHLIPTMTALENVAVPLELALVPNAFERAAEELKALGLGHRVDHYPSQLSGGEQQRVALARAIAPRPGLLFADEPTGNLDGRTGGEIMSLMFALQRERGTTLILVTHDEDLVRRCDRVVRLRDGRIDGIETIEHTSSPIMMPAHPAGTFEPMVTVAMHRPVVVEPIIAEPPAVEPIAEPPEVEPTRVKVEIEDVPVHATTAAVIESPQPVAAPVEAAPVVEVIEAAFEPAFIETALEPRSAASEPAPTLAIEPETELAIETPGISEAAPAEPVLPETPQPEQIASDIAPDPEPDIVVTPSSDEPISEHKFRRVAAGGE